jgi:hypothetical protein
MVGLRLLNNGKWNKPPVLAAARKLLIEALGRYVARKPLGDMAEFVNGTSYSNDLLSEEGRPIIRISNITDPTSMLLKTKESFEDRYSVSSGDLLVSWSASFKSIIWPGPSAILNQHIFRVRELAGNDKSFIRHAIEAVFDEMQQKVVGIGMMHLRRQDFLGHEVPCPTNEIQSVVSGYLDWIESGSNCKEPSLPNFLGEQRRIISRIAELAAKAEEAKRLRNTASEQTKMLFTSAISEALESRHAKHQPLKSVCVQITDGEHATPLRIPTREVPLVTAKNVRDGHLDLKYTDFVSKPTAEKCWNRCRPQHEDILMVCVGATTGRVCRLEKPPEMVIVRSVALFRPDRNVIEPKYLEYALESPACQSQIWQSVKQAAQPCLYIHKMNELKIPVPEMRQQREVITALDTLHAKVKSLEKFQSETAAELDSLVPSILSWAVEGGL